MSKSDSYLSNDARDSSSKCVSDCSDSDNVITSESTKSTESLFDEYIEPLKPLEIQASLDLSQFAKEIKKEYDCVVSKCAVKEEVSVTFLNKDKNRYRNILPFEDTRVRLLDNSTGYINANYISEDNVNHIYRNHKYIATQGPLETTVSDFWQMIWQNDTEIVVMVCKLYEKARMKCYKYWPHNKKTNHIDRGLHVEHSNTKKIRQDIIVRTFILTKDCNYCDDCNNCDDCKEPRTIYQIQLSGWPDFGVPKVSVFTNFINVYREYQSLSKLNGHNIVHCSAGIGRTGTFLAIDIGLNQILTGSLCNIKNIVSYLRTKRGKLIQTAEQYLFVYKILLHFAIKQGLNPEDELTVLSKSGNKRIRLTNSTNSASTSESLFRTIVCVLSKNKIK